MPLHSKKHINNGIVALWKINESFDELLDLVPDSWIAGLAIDKLSKHNLAARTLANEVCPGFELLEKDEYGKPYFESAVHNISITHAGEYAGFMLKEDSECGIDMEHITSRIKKLGPKFIREDERHFSQLGLEGMYMVWCAKEALYKYYGLKALDFKKHIRVEEIETIDSSGSLVGHINKGKYSKSIKMQYQFIEDYLIVHTI